ncbi:MAG: AsmA family protein [Gammaproteobacteria bacterium]|nr:AsmA family protein [Gammaproteobacteria bacterium]
MRFFRNLYRNKRIQTILILFISTLVLGLGLLNKLSPIIDISEYQDEIFPRLGEALQRKFTIDGKLTLKLSLKPTLSIQNLKIENASWGKEKYFLTSEHAEVGIDIVDYFFGNITIDRLILNKAKINLEQISDNKRNWLFGTQKKSTQQQSKSLVRLDYAVLDDVSINYVSSTLSRAISIEYGLLRRSLRGRYFIELNSQLTGKNFSGTIKTNRWFIEDNLRPLNIAAEIKFGDTQFSSEINLSQISPRLSGEINVNSSKLNVDEISRLMADKKKIQPKQSTDIYGKFQGLFESIGVLGFKVDVNEFTKGHHTVKGLMFDGQLAYEPDSYVMNLSARANNIINNKNRQTGLFGVVGNAEQGNMKIELNGNGNTFNGFLSKLQTKVKINNLSVNKPYPYIIHEMEINSDKQDRLTYSGKVTYRETPVELSGKTEKSFYVHLFKSKLMQMYSRLSSGRSDLYVAMTFRNLFSQFKKLDIDVKGNHLSEWSTAVAKKLPIIEKFYMQTRLQYRTDGIKANRFLFVTDKSRLKGKFYYHYGKPATFNMQLVNSHLAISDTRRTPVLEPELKPEPVKKAQDIYIENDEEEAEQVKSAGPMVIPATDLMSLLSPTTKVNFEFKSSSVIFNKFTIREMDLKTRWEDKIFATQVTKGKLAKGDLTSDIYLTVVDNEAAGKIEINVKQLDYGHFMQEAGLGDKMKGTADVVIHLVGFGKDLKTFLTHSDGEAAFVGEKGILASKYLRLWGEDITQYILPFNWFEGDETQLNCVVGRFDLSDGRLSSDSLLIDTEGMTIAGTGAINLNTEEVAFELMPDPKNVSLLSLATPVKIRGTMGRPRIEPHALGTTWTIGSLLAGLANPAILIARFAKLGSLGENPCLAAIGKKEGEEEETSILKMFKDAVKFIQRPLDKMPDLE